MPGQKSFIGNRHPGFYSDKYGISLSTLVLSSREQHEIMASKFYAPHNTP